MTERALASHSWAARRLNDGVRLLPLPWPCQWLEALKRVAFRVPQSELAG